MHFDDRLGTVLRLSAGSPAVLRIQFRQLLDLLGTLPGDARGDQLDAAYDRLGELAGVIPAAERAGMIAESGLRLRSARLVAALATSDEAVAEAALRRAQLSSEEWIDLVPALPPAIRPHLRNRTDLGAEVVDLLARLGVNRSLPPVTAPQEVEAAAAPAEVIVEHAPAPAAAVADEGEGIGAIVKRIEAYRRARQSGDMPVSGDSPRLPLGEDHVLLVSEDVRAFDFATDADARITWADPGVTAMVHGLRLESAARSAGFGDLVRRRQPLRAAAMQLEGAAAIAGQWQLDAAPWFDPLTGRYLGYRGRMRRPAPLASRPAIVAESESDRLRQLLHELRTPVNAIQVGAEIIQQQLFGPTPHEYRALAAGIAADAARMLSAFEELERLAKLQSGAMELDPGQTDLTTVFTATIAQLGAHTAHRGSGFSLKDEPPALPVALSRLEVERIAWRLLATLAGVSAPGEVLKVRIRQKDGAARIDLALPATLASREGDEVFQAAAGAMPQILSAGVFGVGFALRLARAEARAAGGDLVRKDNRLRLILPGLTASQGGHTHAAEHEAPGTVRP